MRVKTSWVAGASGLVGGALLERLLASDDFETVVAVGRRSLPIQRLKLRQATVDFADPGAFAALDAPEAAFCCLGTTIKKAGSPEAFRAVDLDAVVHFARAAREKGAKSFLLVSALGADARSAMLYNKVKGQAEDAVAALGFESVYAFRPSILDGDRAESRPLEKASLVVGRALGPLLGKYRPTLVSSVAEAMVAAARKPKPGVHVVERFDR